MQNIFNSVQQTRPPRSVFDLSHDHKTTFDMGFLVPTMLLECVPGDRFTLGCESLTRFQPLIAPVMHRMDQTTHYFFVANRLLWDGWEDWIMGKPGAAAHPTIKYGDTGLPTSRPYDALMNYLGLPALAGVGDEQVSAFPFAALQFIYQEYYRDQNLVADVDYKLVNGDNTANDDLFVLRLRAWQHDYFTAALPFAQKGDPVTIPILQDFPDMGVVLNDAGGTTLTGAPDSVAVQGVISDNPTLGLYVQGADIEPVATTINDLRRAMRLQEFLELDARGGTRYTENILAHFGVKNPDSRLQRPEYITGTKSPVVISEVLNTAGQNDGLPQGNMSGHGISVTSGRYGRYIASEHGYIIGITSVLPLPAYQQGIHRHWSKWTDRFLHYWPKFANIGEQEVLCKELYADPSDGDDTDVFGYVPRYAEYKFMPSRVSGQFQTTLSFWHLGRIFDDRPRLNEAFINCDATKRVFAVVDEENSLLLHILHKIKAVRCMPKYGTPTI